MSRHLNGRPQKLNPALSLKDHRLTCLLTAEHARILDRIVQSRPGIESRSQAIRMLLEEAALALPATAA